MAVLDRPSAMSPEHLTLAVAQAVERAAGGAARRAGPRPGDRAPSPLADPVDRLDEVGDVEDPVLQEVADPAAGRRRGARCVGRSTYWERISTAVSG